MSATTEAIIARMTLPEKIGQLTMVSADRVATGPIVSSDYLTRIRAGRAGSILNLWGPEATRELQRVALEETRLGIPLLMGFDVVHGHRTIFPIPLAEAAAFDPALWEATAQASALEAAADGIALVFAPMLDVARDPRWGRIAEGPGEDPWLACRIAEAKTRGIGGAGVAGSAKHFVAYGAALAGRDYAEAEVSERTLHEVYLPPFLAALRAGIATIMPAFNTVGGVPMTVHLPLLVGLLRQRWGFDGVVVSDYNAIGELIAHGVAAGPVEAAALALNAGIDIDMMAGAYEEGLPVALERGLVDIEAIDRAVRRVLALKERLGLFEAPYRRGAEPLPAADWSAHRALARDAARRSIVLMTNRGGVLPLQGAPRRLAVLGPLAGSADDMLGPWAGAGEAADCVTPLQGVREALPGWPVDHADGEEIEAAVALAAAADLVILCVGETREMSGEAASRGRLDLPGRQEALARAVLATGKPLVVLLSSGRPLPLPWLFEAADAVLATWFLGVEAGQAMADVLTGAWNPSGRLPVSWPADVGQIPIFHSRLSTGRPADPTIHYSSKYLDLSTQPLFPFGHGLSYSRFHYGAARATPARLGAGERLTVEVEVTNEGPVAGEETVLLFIHDPVASVARPGLELKGMAKLRLEPGATGTVRIEVASDDLAFIGQDLEPRLEPGIIELWLGPVASPERLTGTTIEIIGNDRRL